MPMGRTEDAHCMHTGTGDSDYPGFILSIVYLTRRDFVRWMRSGSKIAIRIILSSRVSFVNLHCVLIDLKCH